MYKIINNIFHVLFLLNINNNLIMTIGLLSCLCVFFVVSAPLNMKVDAQKQENTTNEPIEFLAIQNAKSGSIHQINETAYTLQLNNIPPITVLFSDRPDRIVITVSTSDFDGNWTAGRNSFSSDPPNDALLVENIDKSQLETIVISSFNPLYDDYDNTLNYAIVAKNSTIPLALQRAIGNLILVIDDSGAEGSAIASPGY